MDRWQVQELKDFQPSHTNYPEDFLTKGALPMLFLLTTLYRLLFSLLLLLNNSITQFRSEIELHKEISQNTAIKQLILTTSLMVSKHRCSPLPIPNREVKPLSRRWYCLHRWESRFSPTSFNQFKASLFREAFFI